MTTEKVTEPILIIDTQNFNEILSGVKKEEYRSLSEFYARIFMNKTGAEYLDFKPIKAVWFALGYATNRKMMKVEVKAINIDRFINFIPEGFKKGDETFTLDLGEILDSVNINP